MLMARAATGAGRAPTIAQFYELTDTVSRPGRFNIGRSGGTHVDGRPQLVTSVARTAEDFELMCKTDWARWEGEAA